MAKSVHNKKEDNRRGENNKEIEEKSRFNLLHYNECLLANIEKAFNGVWDGAKVQKLQCCKLSFVSCLMLNVVLFYL